MANGESSTHHLSSDDHVPSQHLRDPRHVREEILQRWPGNLMKTYCKDSLFSEVRTLTHFNVKKTITALQLLSSKVRRFPILFGRLEGF